MGDRAPSTKTTLLASGFRSGAGGIEFINLGSRGSSAGLACLGRRTGPFATPGVCRWPQGRFKPPPLLQRGPVRHDPRVGVLPRGDRQPPRQSDDADLNLLYPSPRTQTAKELGLPVTNALIPHCVLLVASHPAITPSFLEKLELFDKNGKLVGFVPTDSGYRLVSHKDRRGHKLAQQIISLTAHTTDVVSQIIALTQPLRDYLKEHKDDSWRYLFLTCGKGFAYPSRIRSLSAATNLPDRSRQLADALGDTSSLIYEERLALAKRFSLQSLRASAGVLIYLNTKNAEKMAKAFRVLFGAVQICVGTLMARRQGELLDLVAGQCLDVSKTRLVFFNRKSGVLGMREKEARPIPKIAVQMIPQLERLQEGFKTHGVLKENDHLFAFPSCNGDRFIDLGHQRLNGSMDFFRCDCHRKGERAAIQQSRQNRPGQAGQRA